MRCILCSRLDLYDKDDFGNKTPKNFGNENRILDNVKRYTTKYDNFLFVTNNELDCEATDIYANITFKSFEMTLPFKNYQVLDFRTIDKIDTLIRNADFIFLCGGHLPTQNKFFNDINLREKIKNTEALIVGASAGAMNMADTVYSIPEIEGESNDPNFEKNLKGLGLTNINILPHYDKFVGHILDGKRFIEDIVLPDTYKRKVYGISDGSYILIDNKEVYLYGEAYLLENGKIKKLNNDNEITNIASNRRRKE